MHVRSLGLGRSPGGSHGNPLQYSCLGNPMDRGAWWATVHGSQSRTRLKQLSTSLHSPSSTQQLILWLRSKMTTPFPCRGPLLCLELNPNSLASTVVQLLPNCQLSSPSTPLPFTVLLHDHLSVVLNHLTLILLLDFAFSIPSAWTT